MRDHLARIRERATLRAEQLLRMSELVARNLTSSAPAVASGGPVVSLTSFGRRARTVAFTIESIAAGDVLPSRLILWLDEAELRSSPPLMLRRLRERGVEILPTEDLGPHKKYYPYVQQAPLLDVPLVTADDDVLYPRDWLSKLMARYAEHPGDVHCYRARVVGLTDATFDPYASWSECGSTQPSHRHFSIGMAGVLFPPAVLKALKQSGDAFRESCPRTDDIWLNLHAQRVGARVRQVSAAPHYFMLLPGTQKVGLLHTNVAGGGGNDSALRAVYSASDLARLLQAT